MELRSGDCGVRSDPAGGSTFQIQGGSRNDRKGKPRAHELRLCHSAIRIPKSAFRNPQLEHARHLEGRSHLLHLGLVERLRLRGGFLHCGE